MLDIIINGKLPPKVQLAMDVELKRTLKKRT